MKFLLRARVIRLKSLKKKILSIGRNQVKIIYLFKNQTAKCCKLLLITCLQNSMTQWWNFKSQCTLSLLRETKRLQSKTVSSVSTSTQMLTFAHQLAVISSTTLNIPVIVAVTLIQNMLTWSHLNATVSLRSTTNALITFWSKILLLRTKTLRSHFTEIILSLLTALIFFLRAILKIAAPGTYTNNLSSTGLK